MDTLTEYAKSPIPEVCFSVGGPSNLPGERYLRYLDRVARMEGKE